MEQFKKISTYFSLFRFNSLVNIYRTQRSFGSSARQKDRNYAPLDREKWVLQEDLFVVVVMVSRLKYIHK